MRHFGNYKNKTTTIIKIENKKKGIKNDSKNTTNIQRLNKVNVHKW